MRNVVCMDLDGTLLRPDKTVSELSVRALKQLHQLGVEIMIATGRQYRVAKKLIHSLDFPVIISYANGAAARSTLCDKLLLHMPIASDTVQKLRSYSEDYTVAGMAHMDYGHIPELYALSDNGKEAIYEYARDLGLSVSLLSKDQTTDEALSIVFIGTFDELFQLETRIRKSGVPTSLHVMQNAIDVSLLEVMHPSISKGASLLSLLEMRGLSDSFIIAIGDDMNDLSLIRTASMGVAMKNGVPDLMEHADVVTKYTNADDGVARFLCEHFHLSI